MEIIVEKIKYNFQACPIFDACPTFVQPEKSGKNLLGIYCNSIRIQESINDNELTVFYGNFRFKST